MNVTFGIQQVYVAIPATSDDVAGMATKRCLLQLAFILKCHVLLFFLLFNPLVWHHLFILHR